MGRPRKPTWEHKLNGTYREDRHGNRVEVGGGTMDPNPPIELSDDEGVLWTQVVESLSPEVVCPLDITTLYALCRWWGIWCECEKAIREKGPEDSYRLHIQAVSAWKQFAALAAKFGLTPIDRAKLDFPPPKQHDPLAQFGITTNPGVRR